MDTEIGRIDARIFRKVTRMAPYGPVQTHIWVLIVPDGLVWSRLVLYGPVPYGFLWTHLALYGTIWSCIILN